MSPIVVAHDVSFELANGRQLFNSINFSLDDTLTALIGPNGVGKTCLASIIAGCVEPTAGVVRRNGSVTLFAQRCPPESMTVAEFLAVDYEWSLLGDRLLTDIDVTAPCTTLSGGQWMRVRLARELTNDFLILDEPTNDLDRDGRVAVLQFLRERKGGCLLISHDRECLQLCNEFIELSNRGLMKFSGGWTAYLAAKDSERERLNAALDSAKRERDAAAVHRAEQRARQDKRNRRGTAAAARGGIPRILLGARKSRAQTTSGKLDVETLERTTAAVRSAHHALSELKIDPIMYADAIGQALPDQKLVAEAHAFNIRFKDWLYPDDLDLSWRGNVRVAINGANGSGKTALVRALLGEPLQVRGELRRGNLRTLYLDQRCSLLDDRKSVLENIHAVSSATHSEIRTGLARFLFAGDKAFQKAGELSGGERMRACLARGLLGTYQPELIVLDEPTNNLDLSNVSFLEQLVSEFNGAVIVISHDDVFLNHCNVTQVLELKGRPN